MVKGDQWVGYEDATSITKKVKHVEELNSILKKLSVGK